MLLKSTEVAGLRLEVHSSTLGIKKGMDILQMLYDSEINFELSCFWDAGFIWKLGDDANGYVAEGNTRTVEEATTALADAVLTHFPESDFAKKFERLPTAL